MPTYVYDAQRGEMVEKTTREPMLTPAEKAQELQSPRTHSDLPGYQSPIDGSWIEGRRARRYDMEKNNCVDANELGSPTGGKLRNKNFAKKHGLEHLLKQ